MTIQICMGMVKYTSEGDMREVYQLVIDGKPVRANWFNYEARGEDLEQIAREFERILMRRDLSPLLVRPLNGKLYKNNGEPIMSDDFVPEDKRHSLMSKIREGGGNN